MFFEDNFRRGCSFFVHTKVNSPPTFRSAHRMKLRSLNSCNYSTPSFDHKKEDSVQTSPLTELSLWSTESSSRSIAIATVTSYFHPLLKDHALFMLTVIIFLFYHFDRCFKRKFCLVLNVIIVRKEAEAKFYFLSR